MMPYLIWAPDYVNHSGGIRVLHRLCHLLNTSGFQASVTSSKTNPDWNEPRANDFTESAKDAITVYPEIISGNPFGGARVARFILNVPGRIGGDGIYSPTDALFEYSTGFFPGASLLTIPTIETEIFFNRSLDRDKTCFWVGKGNNTRIHPDGSVEITRCWPQTRQGVADLLNHSKVFYSYDTLTFLTHEAIMCGCEVVTPDQSYSPHAHFAQYMKEIEGFQDQFQNFVKITQEL